MSASIVCTAERKRDVNYARNDLKQKLQYRAQCVKERSYSTAPITPAINTHTIYTPTLTERERARERESEREREREPQRERERERDEKRRKRENANTMKIDTIHRSHLSYYTQTRMHCELMYG